MNARRKFQDAFLSLVYGLCFVPGALILRVLKQDPMQKKPDMVKPSYWKKPETHSVSDSMKYPF